MEDINYRNTHYVMGAAKVKQLPEDAGVEIAFAGRSNSGKSSTVNFLTDQKKLAKISKQPGHTRLINIFQVTDDVKLVDLPGYGYAKVPKSMKEEWQKTLTHYLQSRQCLHGIVLVMDIRHPMTEFDINMIDWCIESQLPVHILLNKSDKLNNHDKLTVFRQLKEEFDAHEGDVTIQLFSTLKKEGLPILQRKLAEWINKG
mgnify:CR=1 FL=1